MTRPSFIHVLQWADGPSVATLSCGKIHLRQDIATGTSYGGPIDASLAGRIAWALRPPLRYAQVRTASFYDDAGFCPDCEVPYCHQHWHPSDTGYGYCPYGHGKDLDPQWSPLADFTRCTQR